MMGDAWKFIHISSKNSGHVTFGDNNKGKILGVGNIGMNLITAKYELFFIIKIY